MGRMVFVEAWQMQCCGAPFGVGDEVAWTTVAPNDQGPHLEKMLGERAGEVTEYEEHHGAMAPTLRCRGRVVVIEAVFCLYQRVSGSLFEPRPGTAEFHLRDRADGRESSDSANKPGDTRWRFVGYLVAVE